jgi:hypothetical protein
MTIEELNKLVDLEIQWLYYYAHVDSRNNLNENSNNIEVDSNDNILFTGQSLNNNNIATIGAFQTTGLTIWETGFIAKFNSNGNMQTFPTRISY